MAPLLMALAAAFGAADRDPLDLYLCDIVLLQNKAVQAEIKLEEAQRAKLNDLADAFAAEARRIEQEAPADSRVERVLRERAALKERVLAALTDAQVKRLAQISLQAMDVVAVLDVRVAERLGVTEAQAAALKAAWEATGRAVAKSLEAAREPVLAKYRAMRPASDAERKALAEALGKELAEADKTAKPEIERHKKTFESAVARTFTDGQKKEWDALKGAPFDFAKEPGLGGQ
jgi:hypothetical protein